MATTTTFLLATLTPHLAVTFLSSYHPPPKFVGAMDVVMLEEDEDASDIDEVTPR
jgi:hypothetical protein